MYELTGVRYTTDASFLDFHAFRSFLFCVRSKAAYLCLKAEPAITGFTDKSIWPKIITMADGQLDQASTILVRYFFFFYFFPLFLSPFLVRSCAIFPVLWTVSFHRLLRSFEQIYSIYSLNLEGSRPITSKFLLQSPPIRPLSNIAISLSLSCSRGSSVYSRVRVLSVSHALRQTNRSSPIAASFRRFSPAFRLDRSPGTTKGLVR